ncbi:MAG: CYTH domain-containing protein [Actinomycetota bacterium]
MPYEIERRFVVDGDVSALCRDGTHIVQGYLWTGKGANLRVRLTDDGAFLTAKGPKRGCVRTEIEKRIPEQQARRMLDAIDPHRLVRKTRYHVDHCGTQWVVDVFDDELAGLVIAEVELDDPTQPLALPDWVGPEVTNDPRYGNSALACAR